MQDENAKKFADRLKRLILAQSATKKSIAEQAGIHPVTLSKYLAGSRIPATTELYSLASVLHVTASWLLTGQDDPKPVNLVGDLGNKPGDLVGHTLKDDTPAYGGKSPPAANAGIYAGILESILPRLSVSELMELAELLHREHPPGWEPLASQAIAILRQKITNIENHGQKT